MYQYPANGPPSWNIVVQEGAWASEDEGFGPWDHEQAGGRRQLGRSTDALQDFDGGGGDGFAVAAHPNRVHISFAAWHEI